MNILFAAVLLVIVLIGVAIAVHAPKYQDVRPERQAVWIGIVLIAALVVSVAWLLWQIWDKFMRGMPFFSF